MIPSRIGADARADEVLDCLGLYCPEPLFRTRLALESLPAGAVLEVLADDPAAEADLRGFAARNRYEFVGIRTDTGALSILLRKGTAS